MERLPKGWQRVLDPKTKRYYYVNHEKKLKSWVCPSLVPADASVSDEATDASNQKAQADVSTSVTTSPPSQDNTNQSSQKLVITEHQPPRAPQRVRQATILESSKPPVVARDTSHVRSIYSTIPSRPRPELEGVRTPPQQGVSVITPEYRDKSLSPQSTRRGMSAPLLSSSPLPSHISRPFDPVRVVSPGTRIIDHVGHSIHQGSERMPLRRSVSPVPGGRRTLSPVGMLDHTTNIHHSAKYLTSPSVLQMRSQGTSPSINAQLRQKIHPEKPMRQTRDTSPQLRFEAMVRYNGQLYDSGKPSHYDSNKSAISRYGTGDKPLSYTEELNRKGTIPLRQARYSPPRRAGQNLRASMSAAVAAADQEFRKRYGSSFSMADNLQLSRSLDADSLSRLNDSSISQTRRSSAPHHSSGGDHGYQRFENFVAESMQHSSAREAELNQLTAISIEQQRYLMQQREHMAMLQASNDQVQMQHHVMTTKFQALMEDNKMLLDQVPKGKVFPQRTRGREVMLPANNITLNFETPVSKSEAMPDPVMRTSLQGLGAIGLERRSADLRSTIGSNRSDAQIESQLMVQMFVNFQEQILQAQKVAESERQRSKDLMTEMIRRSASPASFRQSVNPTRQSMSPSFYQRSPSPEKVPVDSLIDQYLNAYSHGDLRASSPVVIKPFQSETESSERSLSPRILSPKVRHEASPQQALAPRFEESSVSPQHVDTEQSNPMGAKASRQLEAVFENRDAESEESLTPKDESHDSDALQTANLRRLVEYEEHVQHVQHSKPVSSEDNARESSSSLPDQDQSSAINCGYAVPVLPRNWQAFEDNDGRQCYYNTVTHETSWNPPGIVYVHATAASSDPSEDDSDKSEG